MRADHGGNRRALVRASGRPDVLDFSASINPLGLSPLVARAVRRAIREVVDYPEIDATTLIGALADHHGMPPETIVVGHGATEILYLLGRAIRPARAVVVHPAFSEYEAAVEPLGCKIVRVIGRPEEGFWPAPETVAGHVAEANLVFLGHPSNPVGTLVPGRLLTVVADACERLRSVLVVDEAFIDFTEEASIKRQVLERPHLAVVRSMTKFFAIPGIRVGFAFLGSRVRALVEPWCQPWSVSSLAEAAAVAALRDTDYAARTRRAVSAWRERLASGLTRLGFDVHPSAANYLLARAPVPWSAGELARVLASRGIAIRDCASFPGLDARFLRLAVRRPREQARLLDELASIVTIGRAGGR